MCRCSAVSAEVWRWQGSAYTEVSRRSPPAERQSCSDDGSNVALLLSRHEFGSKGPQRERVLCLRCECVGTRERECVCWPWAHCAMHEQRDRKGLCCLNETTLSASCQARARCAQGAHGQKEYFTRILGGALRPVHLGHYRGLACAGFKPRCGQLKPGQACSRRSGWSQSREYTEKHRGIRRRLLVETEASRGGLSWRRGFDELDPHQTE